MPLPAPGDNFGPYQVLGPIGGGGMGMVFRALDTRLQREVALKVLAEHLSTPAMRERFLREARAAATLNHPNICTVFDMGEQDGAPYMVMELLHGKTIKQLCASHPLPVDEILSFGEHAADALAAAHARGIVHRDIKSANLMVVRNEHAGPDNHGQIKVLDFGLAKMDAAGGEDATLMTSSGEMTVMGAHMELTQPGSTVGTVAYMSPEQARGELLDARTDIFSMGTVLYEMATGKLPFAGATSALVFVALLSNEPPPIRETVPDFPRDLEKVILRCLIKDRDHRMPSARELRNELHKLGAHSSGPTPVAVVEYVGGKKLADPESRPSPQKRGGPSPFQQANVVHAPRTSEPAVRTVSTPETPAVVSSGVSRQVDTSSAANRRAAGRTFASSERAAPAAASGEDEAASGGKGKLIGIAAVALLLVALGAYFLLRSNGAKSGSDTTENSGLPAQHQALIFAEFDNKTGDGKLDGLLRSALQLELSQSPATPVMPDSDVRRLLARAGQPPDARLTPDNVAKITSASDARGIVSGSLSKDGGGYKLSASVTDGSKQLAQADATAASLDQIPDAAGKLADKLRAGLGEPRDSLAKFDTSLGKAATTNIAALKSYVDGMANLNGGKYADAAPQFEKALELDPKFALANLALAETYPRLNQPEKAAAALEAAHRTDSHLGPRSRLYVDALYAIRTTGDLSAAFKALDQSVTDFPTDPRPLTLLAELDLRTGDLAKALDAARKLTALAPYSDAGYVLQQESQARLGHAEAAMQVYQDALKAGMDDSAALHAQELIVAYLAGNSGAMSTELNWGASAPAGFLVDIANGYVLADQGQLQKAAAAWTKGAAAAKNSGLVDVAGSVIADEALNYALAQSCGSVAPAAHTAQSLDSSPSTAAKVGIAFGLCRAGDASGMASTLAKTRPQDTLVQQLYAPEMRAAAMLGSGDGAGALMQLQPTAKYAFASQSAYLQGLADIAAKKPLSAPGQLANVTEHRGAFVAGRLLCYPMALAAVSRAYAAAGDKLNAQKAAQRYQAYWKNADRQLSLAP